MNIIPDFIHLPHNLFKSSITIGLVISAELFNTAIEAVVDLVTEAYHPLAKVAKDTSAAAVFILAIVSVIEGIIIFLPKVINLLF